jgi:hypothetical protein
MQQIDRFINAIELFVQNDLFDEFTGEFRATQYEQGELSDDQVADMENLIVPLPIRPYEEEPMRHYHAVKWIKYMRLAMSVIKVGNVNKPLEFILQKEIENEVAHLDCTLAIVMPYARDVPGNCATVTYQRNEKRVISKEDTFKEIQNYASTYRGNSIFIIVDSYDLTDKGIKEIADTFERHFRVTMRTVLNMISYIKKHDPDRLNRGIVRSNGVAAPLAEEPRYLYNFAYVFEDY